VLLILLLTAISSNPPVMRTTRTETGHDEEVHGQSPRDGFQQCQVQLRYILLLFFSF
jgi:hypothetical protein